jgi:hypothetical protein
MYIDSLFDMRTDVDLFYLFHVYDPCYTPLVRTLQRVDEEIV